MEQGVPFVYFHTHVVNRQVLNDVVAAGTSLEIDLSVDEKGMVYIGHPKSFYTYKNIPPPENLPIDEVLEVLRPTSIFLILDCKDIRVLLKVRTIVAAFGSERCLIHAHSDQLAFTPYPPEITVEPHWPNEDLPLEELLKIGRETHVPLALSCRGLTEERLIQENAVFQKIIDVAKENVAAINFNLPNGEIPSEPYIQRLIKAKTLTWVNIDLVPKVSRPTLFLGVSDTMASTTSPHGRE